MARKNQAVKCVCGGSVKADILPVWQVTPSQTMGGSLTFLPVMISMIPSPRYEACNDFLVTPIDEKQRSSA